MNTTEHVTNKGQGKTRIPNKLIDEKSPYLLQHAYNPVKWYPWGNEAFAKAREENKPIFLSIGYSTCHWCHVMERESFEDQEVADYLNRYFVAIKVDKEERPDVDSIYMSVCLKITGSGGWPLSIFMMPDQKPFYAGTYFPKISRYNMPGLMDLLEGVHDKWDNDQDEIIRSANALTGALSQDEFFSQEQGKLSKGLIKKAVRSLTNHFDSEYGGFGSAPKFPTPHNLMFLLQAAYYEDNQEAVDIVEKTLDSMYQGGIFDHIGYGFSRYSTDQKWLVPHFEKMLYDNALLIITYLEVYQKTRKVRYKQIAEMTMEYVLRELTNEQGGFYCAQDADSEGVEGKYYVFTQEEIIRVLGEEDGKLFNEHYGITPKGNFEGKSIPNRMHIKNIADKEEGLEDIRISDLREKVFEYRLKRTKLHKDDKVLTSWNGIMIAAFAKAYQILGNERYLTAAKKADQFIQDKLMNGNRLSVHYRDGKAVGIGHIDDYAFYTWALIELYQASFDPEYLSRAVKFTKILIEQFFDNENGGFYLYAKDGETLIHRPKELYDGAIPSGNSVAAYVLQKLAAYTGDLELTRISDKQLDFIARGTTDYPSGHCFSMMAVTTAVYPSKELICILRNSTDIVIVQQLLAKHFLPNITVLVKTDDNSQQLEQIAEFTKDYEVKDHSTVFYLCENHACMAPVYDLKVLEDILIKKR